MTSMKCSLCGDTFVYDGATIDKLCPKCDKDYWDAVYKDLFSDSPVSLSKQGHIDQLKENLTS